MHVHNFCILGKLPVLHFLIYKTLILTGSCTHAWTIFRSVINLTAAELLSHPPVQTVTEQFLLINE